MAKIKLAVTFYSFTNEQRYQGWKLEDCFKASRELGVSGIEIVGSQSFGRTYPWPTDEEIYTTRNLADKYGLEICAYSGQGDRGKRSDLTDMSEEDMFAYALNDLKYAYKFGAPAQRQQNNISPKAMKMLAPYAEKYRVKVGIEMHQPMTPCEYNSEQFNKVFEEIDSPYIGWTPDFGMFSTGAYNARFAGQVRTIPSRMNVPEEICQFFEDNQGMPVEEAKEKLKAYNPSKELQDILDILFTTGDIAGEARNTLWEDFERVTLPRSVHFHGKFTELGDDGDDINIPTSKVLEVINRSDYEGYISIEYEGHMRFQTTPVYPILKRHVAFYNNVLGIK